MSEMDELQVGAGTPEQTQPQKPIPPRWMCEITIQANFKDGKSLKLSQPCAFNHPEQLKEFMAHQIADIRKLGGFLTGMEDGQGLKWIPLECCSSEGITVHADDVRPYAEMTEVVPDTNVRAASILAAARAARDKAMKDGKVVGFPNRE